MGSYIGKSKNAVSVKEFTNQNRTLYVFSSLAKSGDRIVVEVKELRKKLSKFHREYHYRKRDLFFSIVID